MLLISPYKTNSMFLHLDYKPVVNQMKKHLVIMRLFSHQRTKSFLFCYITYFYNDILV